MDDILSARRLRWLDESQLRQCQSLSTTSYVMPLECYTATSSVAASRTVLSSSTSDPHSIRRLFGCVFDMLRPCKVPYAMTTVICGTYGTEAAENDNGPRSSASAGAFCFSFGTGTVRSSMMWRDICPSVRRKPCRRIGGQIGGFLGAACCSWS